MFAFVGALVAVALTFALGAAGGRNRTPATLVLAGVAVSAFLAAGQSYVQQRYVETIREVYSWILGRLTTAGWHDVLLLLPYALVTGIVMISQRRQLDVMSVGDEEATSLGAHPRRTRLILIIAASLGTAAAVSVSGLIGFVGIIVPHTVRLMVGHELPRDPAAVGALRRGVPGARRPRRPHPAGARRDPDRRGHGVLRRAVLHPDPAHLEAAA